MTFNKYHRIWIKTRSTFENIFTQKKKLRGLQWILVVLLNRHWWFIRNFAVKFTPNWVHIRSRGKLLHRNPMIGWFPSKFIVHPQFNMKIFQTIFVVINFSPCDAFQSLNDLENFYKTASAYDPFRATGIGRYHWMFLNL